MIVPDTLVFHDETGSTHPGSPFAHIIGVAKADNILELQSDIAALRRDARIRPEVSVQWKKCSASSRSRSQIRFGHVLMDWYETRGHELLGISTEIFDRSDPQWDDSWVLSSRDYHIYNATAATSIAHSLAYLSNHRPSRSPIIKVFSDYRSRHSLDGFYTEVLPRVCTKCQKISIRTADAIVAIGASSDMGDPEARMASEILQIVDLLGGISFGVWSPKLPANHIKKEWIERASSWHETIRPFNPAGSLASMKRSYDIMVSSPGKNSKRDRFFKLHHIPEYARVS